MDVNRFLQQLLEELSHLPFVKNLDLNTEVFVIKGRVLLENNFFLQVYFNARTKTTAFALIIEEKRKWGIDFDSIRGWHLHPVENPDDHLVIEPKTIKEIIAHLEKAWDFLFGFTGLAPHPFNGAKYNSKVAAAGTTFYPVTYILSCHLFLL